MQFPLSLDATTGHTLQGQLFEQIRNLILSGQLRPGSGLPATRELSKQLGVSRNTVVLAYERLLCEGYIESRQSVGTFVTDSIPDRSIRLRDTCRRTLRGKSKNSRVATQVGPIFRGRAQSVVNPHRADVEIDFWVGRPDPGSFPIKAWRTLINRRLTSAGSCLTEYQDPQGLPELRQVISEHLALARGITVGPDQVVVTGGSQDGLMLVAKLLVAPGSHVVLESPCYQGAAYVFESQGGEILPLEVDADGIKTSLLPDEESATVYVTPSHQYPLGSTLSLKRRLELLEWAHATKSYVIEDDYDSDFRYTGSPLTALKGLDDRGSVIYLGTFSKCMGAAIRLGFLVLPRELVGPARTLKTLMSNGQPWLEQAAMADFMSSGGLNRHLRQIRKLYLARRDCLIRELTRCFGEVRLTGIDGGMHLVWRIPDRFPPAWEIEQLALEKGIGVYGIDSGGACVLSQKTKTDHLLVFGYSSVTRKQIAAGVDRLACVLGGGIV